MNGRGIIRLSGKRIALTRRIRPLRLESKGLGTRN